MNSREKGKRGERQWRDELRHNGYAARRGQQYCGSPDSPDVVCNGLPWIHFEVKAVERLNVQDAMDQACTDAGQSKTPILVHKRNFRMWLVTMEAETFLKFLRGDLPPRPPEEIEIQTSAAEMPPAPSGAGEKTISDITREARVVPENQTNEEQQTKETETKENYEDQK